MERPAVPADQDLETRALSEIERGENADDTSRLQILDELYQVLESELDEDAPARP